MTLPKIERVVNVGETYSFTFEDKNVLQVKYYDKFERRIVRKNAAARRSKRGKMRDNDIAAQLMKMRADRAECQRLSSNSHEARRLWNAELADRREKRGTYAERVARRADGGRIDGAPRSEQERMEIEKARFERRTGAKPGTR